MHETLIVNALSGVVTASVQEQDAEAESKSPMELTSADLLPMTEEGATLKDQHLPRDQVCNV